MYTLAELGREPKMTDSHFLALATETVLLSRSSLQALIQSIIGLLLRDTSAPHSYAGELSPGLTKPQEKAMLKILHPFKEL